MSDTDRGRHVVPQGPCLQLFRKTLASLALVAFGVPFVPQASAQPYPGLKPVVMIVPFAAGSATDTIGRIVADGLSQTLGQKVIVENRAGAGGAIGLEALARSAPDGYTIGVASTSTYVLTAALAEKRPYDVLKDFMPVAVTNDLPLIVASTAQLSPRNLKEMIAYLQANHTLFVSAGPGTSAHVLGSALVHAAGGKGDAVHYKSSSAGIPDLLTGRVSFTVDGPGSVAPHIKEGKLVGLAFFAGKRVAILPEVPTMEETWPEAPDYMKQASVSIILLPARTPPNVVAKLNSDINRAMQDPAIKDRIERAGLATRAPMSVDQIANLLRRSVEAWTEAVTTTGIKDAVKATSN